MPANTDVLATETPAKAKAKPCTAHTKPQLSVGPDVCRGIRTSVPLASLRLDGGTQIREEIKDDVVAEYAEALAAGAEFPPVVVYHESGKYWLADGFHRVQAARAADLSELQAEVREGSLRDAVLYAVGANADHGLPRTNADKRRAVTVLLQDEEWQRWSDKEIARQCAVSDRFVAKVRKELSANGSQMRIVERGGTRYEMHVEGIGGGDHPSSALPPEESGGPASSASDPLTDATEAEILTRAKEIRARKDKENRTRKRAALVELATATASPVESLHHLYPVILADPAWQYGHSISASRDIENQYVTMTTEEICDLPVSKICTGDAVLFLWTTSPMLADAMRVIAAWGFTYKTCAVWDKEIAGNGYWFRQQHELLLVAVRGNIMAAEEEGRVSSVIRSRRRGHSVKPDIVYEIIEGMYPDLPYLELFARRRRPGWDAWGNEVTDQTTDQPEQEERAPAEQEQVDDGSVFTIEEKEELQQFLADRVLLDLEPVSEEESRRAKVEAVALDDGWL